RVGSARLSRNRREGEAWIRFDPVHGPVEGGRYPGTVRSRSSERGEDVAELLQHRSAGCGQSESRCRLRLMLIHEGAYRLHETRKCRLVLQKQMIVAFESHEAGAGNPLREFQPPLVRNARVITTVKNERGHIHLRKPLTNIHEAQRFLNPNRILGRRRDTHEFIHPANLLHIAVRYESRSKYLPECRIVLSPSVKN